MRIMALDPGRKRVGVAVSDETGLLASPVTVIERSALARDLQRIRGLVCEYQPRQLLVGLPLLASGERGTQAEYSERFAEVLANELGLPVCLWNESFSSVEARRRRKLRSRGRDRDAPLDAEAAAIFLQEYLDSRR